MVEKNHTVGEILIKSEDYLRKKGIKNPRLEAELLLALVYSTDRLWVYMNWLKKIEKSKLDELREYLLRRVKGEPLHYILGYKEFMTLKLFVEPGVLVPRFETEELVEKVIEDSRRAGYKVFADLGTGSGAIAISIAKFIEDSFVYAVDISDKALRVAEKNIEANRVREKIKLFKGDLLEPLRELFEQIEVFVSNPPYVSEDEWESLSREIVEYEPREAILAPENGLFYYRKILENLSNLRNKVAYFEISPTKVEEIKKLVKNFEVKTYSIFNDIVGKPRILKVEF